LLNRATGVGREDVNILENGFHEGVIGLSGSALDGTASDGRTMTRRRVNKTKEKTLSAAVSSSPVRVTVLWPCVEAPGTLYLYLQDPGTAIGLYRPGHLDKLGFRYGRWVHVQETGRNLIPVAALGQVELVEHLKGNCWSRSGGQSRFGGDADKIKWVQSVARRLPLASSPAGQEQSNHIAGTAAEPWWQAMGAAAGALMGRFTNQVQGKVQARIRYLPIPQTPWRARNTPSWAVPN
jgi:hypothetical protein